MRESKRPRRRRSKPIRDNSVSNDFGICVIALARGIKPGDWLAGRIRALGGNITVRNADRLINGEVKVTAIASAAITNRFIR